MAPLSSDFWPLMALWYQYVLQTLKLVSALVLGLRATDASQYKKQISSGPVLLSDSHLF